MLLIYSSEIHEFSSNGRLVYAQLSNITTMSVTDRTCPAVLCANSPYSQSELTKHDGESRGSNSHGCEHEMLCCASSK